MRSPESVAYHNSFESVLTPFLDAHYTVKSHLFPMKAQAKFQETGCLTASQGRFQVVKRTSEPVLTMAIEQHLRNQNINLA